MNYLIYIFVAVASTLNADSRPPLDRQVQNMQHQMSNQDHEIAAMKQQLSNFETILDSTHKEVSSLISSAKESQKKATGTVDTRLKATEKNLEKLVQDLKSFKKQSNEVATSFSSLQKKIQEQEEITALQAQQIKDLENALRSLASAMQSKNSRSGINDKTYSDKVHQVKAGDSLEKIAREYGTTIEAIRTENNLQKDTIYPGQKLQIPS